MPKIQATMEGGKIIVSMNLALAHGRSTREVSYKLSSGRCAVCGKTGGEHYSPDGISWCYPLTDRTKFKDPMFRTSFAYSKLSDNNPNKTFKREI